MSIFKKKKIECEHIFSDFVHMPDYENQCILVSLKCELCGKVEQIRITQDLLNRLLRR